LWGLAPGTRFSARFPAHLPLSFGQAALLFCWLTFYIILSLGWLCPPFGCRPPAPPTFPAPKPTVILFVLSYVLFSLLLAAFCEFVVAISACNSLKTAHNDKMWHLFLPQHPCEPKTEALNYVIKFVYQGIWEPRPPRLKFDKVSSAGT